MAITPPQVASQLPDTGRQAHLDEDVRRFGYQNQLTRSIRPFTNFALIFSTLSITVGIFSTFSFTLTTGGPAGIWLWPIAGAGMLLVCLVLAQLAARIPLSGTEYQWASRIMNPSVGWGFGWLVFVWACIGVAAVDYGLAQTVIIPLFGLHISTGTTQLITIGIFVIQAMIIIWSARLTAMVNATAVGTELAALLGIALILLGVIIFGHHHSWSNLTSRGAIPRNGYFGINGAFMLCIVPIVFTISAFENGSSVAEETESPTSVVPTAMIRAVALSAIAATIFMIILTVAIPNVKTATASSSPVAYVMKTQVGAGFEKVFLAIVCVSFFSCGLCVMMAVSRLVFAMSRDRRFPGHQVFRLVPNATHTPAYATVLCAGVSAIVTVALGTNTLNNLFTASAILPGIIYLLFILVYLASRHRLPNPAPGVFTLGRWENAVIGGSIVWLVIVNTALLFPSIFWAPVRLIGLLVAIGAVFFVVGLITDRDAFSRERGAMTIDDALAHTDDVIGERAVGT